jgi:hypothetical protein
MPPPREPGRGSGRLEAIAAANSTGPFFFDRPSGAAADDVPVCLPAPFPPGPGVPPEEEDAVPPEAADVPSLVDDRGLLVGKPASSEEPVNGNDGSSSDEPKGVNGSLSPLDPAAVDDDGLVVVDDDGAVVVDDDGLVLDDGLVVDDDDGAVVAGVELVDEHGAASHSSTAPRAVTPAETGL